MSNLALLGVGLLVFACTLGASISGTYAWYTIAKIGNVSTTEFKVDQNAAKIDIGMKDEEGEIHYFDQIGDEDLALFNESYNPNSGLRDLSSMWEELWLNPSSDPNVDKPLLHSVYANGEVEGSKPASSGFLQFEFYLLSSDDMYVFLDPKDTFLKANHEKNLEVAEAIGVDVKDLDKVEDAARVSFYGEDGFIIYEPNVDAPSQVELGGLLDINPHDGYFDEKDGLETLYGECRNKEKIVYGEPTAVDPGPMDDNTSFVANHALGVKPINLEASKENGLEIAKEKTHTLDSLSLGENEGRFDPERMKPIAALKGGKSQRLVITVYLEGWDHDVTDCISSARFNLRLSFRGLAAPVDKED